MENDKNDGSPESIVTSQGFTNLNHDALAKVNRSVARIIVEGEEMGTGFMLAGGWLLTCNHVLKNVEQVKHNKTYAEFFYEASTEHNSKKIKLNPDSPFYHSSENDKDWSLVRLMERIPACENILHHKAGFSIGDLLTIFQHPQALYLKSDINRVVHQLDDRMFYTVNTLGGSSGGPVVNQEGQIIGLHQAGSQEVDGKVYNRGLMIKTILDSLEKDHLNIYNEICGNSDGIRENRLCEYQERLRQRILSEMNCMEKLRNFFKHIDSSFCYKLDANANCFMWSPENLPCRNLLRMLKEKLPSDLTPKEIDLVDGILGSLFVLSIKQDHVEKWHQDYFETTLVIATDEEEWPINGNYILDIRELVRSAPLATYTSLSKVFKTRESSSQTANQAKGLVNSRRLPPPPEVNRGVTDLDKLRQIKIALIMGVQKKEPGVNIDAPFKRALDTLKHEAVENADPYYEISRDKVSYKEFLGPMHLVTSDFKVAETNELFQEYGIWNFFVDIHDKLNKQKA